MKLRYTGQQKKTFPFGPVEPGQEITLPDSFAVPPSEFEVVQTTRSKVEKPEPEKLQVKLEIKPEVESEVKPEVANA